MIRKPLTAETQFQLQAICGEFLGTAFFMFFLCISQYQNMDKFEEKTRQEGALFAFFLTSSASFGIGYLSGAHLNPLVTLSVFLLGHIQPLSALCYVGAHIMGMAVGFGLSVLTVQQELYFMYNRGTCGFCYPNLNPKVPVMGALVLEFIASFVLLLCVCGTSDKRTYKFKSVNALRFATLIGLISYTIGPFTGPVLNPFRILIPGIFNNCFKNIWLYFVADTCGSVTATLLYKYALRFPPPSLPQLAVPRTGPTVHLTDLIRQADEALPEDSVEAPLVIGTY